jgi:hypothetical protein
MTIETLDNYTIEIIETIEGLNIQQQEWERLYNLKKGITIFFSFQVMKTYYETILRSFKNVKIEIFIMKNNKQQIIAIFPFTYETQLFPSLFSLKELALKNDYLIDFYYFLIDPTENQDVIIQRFVQFLRKRKWDIMKIKSLPEDEPLLHQFILKMSKTFKIDINEINTLVIDCQGEYEEYIRNMDRKDKKDVNRQYRRIQTKGKVNLIEMKSPAEIEKGLSLFYDIEDSGWKGKEGTSLKRSYYGQYYRDLATQLSKENKFRLYFLQLNEDYIAGIYTIIDQGILYVVKTGYSNEYNQYSPSKVLAYLLFEKIFREKTIQKIDYYGPFLEYEKSLGKTTRKRYHITICNKKILPTIYFIALKILKKMKYPFPENSLKQKIIRSFLKHIYS